MGNKKNFKDMDLWYDLPIEIQDRMLKEQVMQGNPLSQIPFMNDIGADIEEGGFSWHDSDAGGGFWAEVINGSYGLFYEKYGDQAQAAEKEKKQADEARDRAQEEVDRYKAHFQHSEQLPYWKTDHFSGFCKEHLHFLLEITENPEVAADQVHKIYHSLFVKEEDECCDNYVTPSKYGLSEGVEICCHLNGDSIHYEVDHRTGSIQLTEAEFSALKEAVQRI